MNFFYYEKFEKVGQKDINRLKQTDYVTRECDLNWNPTNHDDIGHIEFLFITYLSTMFVGHVEFLSIPYLSTMFVAHIESLSITYLSTMLVGNASKPCLTKSDINQN